MSSLLSIILPVYNVENYIERCLRSICSQPEAAIIEIIIVDDGSKDKSVQIANNYLSIQTHLNWRIIHQNNKGLGGARNTGIMHATSPYIWFVDSDDEIANNSLNKILSTINNTDDVLIFSYDQIPGQQASVKSKDLFHLPGVEMFRVVAANQVWRNIYRTEFLKANKIFFREHFLHEDGEFSMRVFALAKHMSFINHVIYKYHTANPNSITNNLSFRNANDLISYINTYAQIKCKYKLTVQQHWVLQKEISNAILYIYIYSYKTNDNEWQKIVKLIKLKRKQIYKNITLLSLKTKIIHYLLSYFPNKSLCKILFVKTI